jgi:excisionase family DNA binding protein
MENIRKELEENYDQLITNEEYKTIDSIILYLQNLKKKEDLLYDCLKKERELKEEYQNQLMNVTNELIELKIGEVENVEIENLLATSKVAEILNKSTSFVYKQMELGTIKFIRLSERKVGFKRSDVDDFLNKQIDDLKKKLN